MTCSAASKLVGAYERSVCQDDFTMCVIIGCMAHLAASEPAGALGAHKMDAALLIQKSQQRGVSTRLSIQGCGSRPPVPNEYVPSAQVMGIWAAGVG